MKEIRLEKEVPDDEIRSLEGTHVGSEHADFLIGDPGACPPDWPAYRFFGGPATVYRPDGEVLLRYIPAAVGADVCARAWAVLRTLRQPVTNRGAASGVRASYPVRSDGRRSKTNEVRHRDNPRLKGVGSSVIGAMERTSARLPMCRLTAFNLQHPDRFEAALPFIREVDGVFARELPERHEAQMRRLRETHPAWTISGTSFTTVTVNRSFRTAVHRDKGDLAEGFGVMTALRAGEYEGCYTIFPAFRVAVDMRTRGVLLADVHQWHANTLLVGEPGRFERIACVFYYRRRMENCLSPEEEYEFAANRKDGEPIWPGGAR